ncbi:hypothetical protein B0H19DRAFT_1230140, partial [Mycena capillaripes]
ADHPNRHCLGSCFGASSKSSGRGPPRRRHDGDALLHVASAPIPRPCGHHRRCRGNLHRGTPGGPPLRRRGPDAACPSPQSLHHHRRHPAQLPLLALRCSRFSLRSHRDPPPLHPRSAAFRHVPQDSGGIPAAHRDEAESTGCLAAATQHEVCVEVVRARLGNFLHPIELSVCSLLLCSELSISFCLRYPSVHCVSIVLYAVTSFCIW